MTTQFDQMIDRLAATSARLEPAARTAFLLCYATRHGPIFELFEAKAPRQPVTFDALVERAWDLAEQDSPDGVEPIKLSLDGLVPGVDWIVDGFYDGIAQDVAGLLDGALDALAGREPKRVEGAILNPLRTILSEMRLSASEPGSDARGRAFDEALHREPIVANEWAFAQRLLERVSEKAAGLERLRHEMREQRFNVAALEPELSAGLAADTGR